MRTMQKAIFYTIIVFAILMLSGTEAFTIYLTTRSLTFNPTEIALTPAATFFIILALLGLNIVRQIPQGMAKKRFFAGFTLVFVGYVGLELLLRVI